MFSFVSTSIAPCTLYSGGGAGARASPPVTVGINSTAITAITITIAMYPVISTAARPFLRALMTLACQL